MKINGNSVGATTAATATLPAQRAADTPKQAAAAAGAGAALQSDVLKPAAEALRAQPDFDAARVAELRDALSRGELPFDAGRLAGLIQRFHGAKG